MLFRKLFVAAIILSFASTTLALPGYVTDKATGKIARTKVTGECVKDGKWKPENLVPECDTNAKPPVAKVETPPVAPAPVEEPAVVAPLPEPKPLPAEPLVIEKKKAIHLSASLLFGFDKYTLTDGGKELLTYLADKLNSGEYKSIAVDGYTDRFGSVKYNQVLSEKRAASVTAFLVSAGVDASKIKTKGHGKSGFRTQAADCKNLKTAALKTCYAPDRRVDITVE